MVNSVARQDDPTMTTHPRPPYLRIATLLLLAGAGCAHNREAFYPPGGRGVARGEPPLDPSTPGATRRASRGGPSAPTARAGATRSRDVDESADVFDFEQYRE
jgi:hypothetical protein